MDSYEVALQITLKAMDLGFISPKTTGSTEKITQISLDNAYTINKFFNSVLSNLSNPIED